MAIVKLIEFSRRNADVLGVVWREISPDKKNGAIHENLYKRTTCAATEGGPLIEVLLYIYISF